jgi:hypothetical protein
MNIKDLKIGDRIKLVSMDNDPNPIPVGAKGTVMRMEKLPFEGETQVEVEWDNGRSLSLIFPFDKFELV